MKTRILDFAAGLMLALAFSAAFNGMDMAVSLTGKALAGFLALTLLGVSILLMVVGHDVEGVGK